MSYPETKRAVFELESLEGFRCGVCNYWFRKSDNVWTVFNSEGIEMSQIHYGERLYEALEQHECPIHEKEKIISIYD